MNIVVLNGSPKGELGVTIQYVRFAAKKFPQHSFRFFSVAQNIKRLEKDEAAFREVIDAVQSADAVLWSFPLYFMLVCAQYKRFIELIFERHQQTAFAGKYTASFSTSVHFFDHTAHNYIHAICDDLQMKYTGAYSAGMYDLMNKSERKRWLDFAEAFFDSVSRKIPVALVYPPLPTDTFIFQPGSSKAALDADGKKILVIMDGQDPIGNISAMIQSFAGSFRKDLEIISLTEIDIKGGCLGCCKCGLDNVCDYEGKDGFIDFYKEKVKKADVVVFAGAIHDRYLSAMWKTYFDRSFFNTHMPTLIGKQIAFIVAGPFGHLPNLRQILEAYAEFQETNLAGFVTDEAGSADEINLLLAELAGKLVRPIAEGFRPPMTFLGVGGRKIFRDEVYGMLRFVFQADHRYYKKQGLYDFPQKNYKTRRMNLMMTMLTKFPPFRKKFLKILKEEMVKPLRHVADHK